MAVRFIPTGNLTSDQADPPILIAWAVGSRTPSHCSLGSNLTYAAGWLVFRRAADRRNDVDRVGLRTNSRKLTREKTTTDPFAGY